MADQTLDARRTAREQEQAAHQYSAQVGQMLTMSLMMCQPMFQMQAATFRGIADGLDAMVGSLSTNARKIMSDNV